MGNELVKLEEYQYALAQVETVEEAGALRAKIETIAKQIAPRLRQDRFKWCRGNVEACIKHGELWNACENKARRTDTLLEGSRSKIIENGDIISVADAYFKNHMNARMCGAIATLEQEQVRSYFEECDDTNKMPSLGGAYKFWLQFNPKDEIPQLDGSYRIIYADPPWEYGNVRGDSTYTSQEDKYPTMATEDICAIDVKSHVWDDAVLFLWATSPILIPDASKVIYEWGFRYKTSFVWDKMAHNPGHYNSVRHEFLLIGTRGSCKPDNPKLYPSIQSIHRDKIHSRKPDEFRDIIDDLYTMGPRAEIFARQKIEGWDYYGNEQIP